MTVALSVPELSELFPAYLRLAPDGRIVAAGPSILAHGGGDVVGAEFFARFCVERPSGIVDMGGLRGHGRPMIVRLETPQPVRLRGVVLNRVDEVWVMLGHIPDLGRIDQGPRLLVSDFSPTDGTLDMLMAAEMRSGLLAEARQLAVDLHEQKKAAERANSAKSAFLATMSHEIRTPMNGVLGLASVLAGTALSAEQREMLDVMIASGRSLMDILNDVLDLSKIEAGRIELEYAPFNLGALAQAVHMLFEPMAGARGLVLELAIDAPEPWCTGDEARIRQILVNLVSNAIKFTDAGHVRAEVALRHGAEGSMIAIVVSDTGIGISTGALDHLFQPFVQADNSTTRRFGGTGLGLAISKRLCCQMNGDIRVESRLGRGSKFAVEIPTVLVAGPELAAQPEPQDTRLEFGDPHVLVVEDNATNQFVLSVFLRKMGMTFDLAQHGAEALIAWEARSYDIVLMDIEMPVLDGFEATRELRRREQARGRGRTPIVALSADAMLENRDRARRVGMDDFITKPIEIHRLEALIWTTIRRAAAAARPVASTRSRKR